jgi:predicted secreted protein
MFTRANPALPCQSGHQADRAVAAHPEESDIVKENNPGDTARVLRFDKTSTHHDIRPSRLVHDRAPEAVMLFTKDFEFVRG